MLAVEVRDLAKTFRSGWFPRRLTRALRGVSLSIPRGVIFGLLGPNGAGKTTLLSILATLLLPDAGEAKVLGHDVVREARAIRPRLNMASGNSSFIWSLRAPEILAFYGRLYGLHGKGPAREGGELGAPGAPQGALPGALDGAQAAPGAGQVAGERSGAALPGRAHARPRSRHLREDAGPDRRAAPGARDDHPAHDPLHARGGGALRRDRLHQERRDCRPRHGGRPQTADQDRGRDRPAPGSRLGRWPGGAGRGSPLCVPGRAGGVDGGFPGGAAVRR